MFTSPCDRENIDNAEERSERFHLVLAAAFGHKESEKHAEEDGQCRQECPCLHVLSARVEPEKNSKGNRHCADDKCLDHRTEHRTTGEGDAQCAQEEDARRFCFKQIDVWCPSVQDAASHCPVDRAITRICSLYFIEQSEEYFVTSF